VTGICRADPQDRQSHFDLAGRHGKLGDAVAQRSETRASIGAWADSSRSPSCPRNAVVSDGTVESAASSGAPSSVKSYASAATCGRRRGCSSHRFAAHDVGHPDTMLA